LFSARTYGTNETRRLEDRKEVTASLAGFVDVFNLLNTNPEQNKSGSPGPCFPRPLSIVPPRLARVGVKLEW